MPDQSVFLCHRVSPTRVKAGLCGKRLLQTVFYEIVYDLQCCFMPEINTAVIRLRQFVEGDILVVFVQAFIQLDALFKGHQTILVSVHHEYRRQRNIF